MTTASRSLASALRVGALTRGLLLPSYTTTGDPTLGPGPQARVRAAICTRRHKCWGSPLSNRSRPQPLAFCL